MDISLTGSSSYVVELKLRASTNLLIDATHPYCYSMTPFHARIQIPHAEDRLLGVRVCGMEALETDEEGRPSRTRRQRWWCRA